MALNGSKRKNAIISKKASNAKITDSFKIAKHNRSIETKDKINLFIKSADFCSICMVKFSQLHKRNHCGKCNFSFHSKCANFVDRIFLNKPPNQCFACEFAEKELPNLNCAYCGLAQSRNSSDHFFCKIFDKITNSDVKRYFHTENRNKLCFICQTLTPKSRRNLLKCDYGEECQNFFHLHCAISSLTFNWISIRLSSSSAHPIPPPIHRCAAHSIKHTILKALPSPIRRKDVFSRFLPGFHYDEARLLANFETKRNESFCGVCFSSYSSPSNLFVICENPFCELTVHQKCYGLRDIPSKSWFCDACLLDSRLSAQCANCSFRGGALKMSLGGEWHHPICAMMDPAISVDDLKQLATTRYEQNGEWLEIENFEKNNKTEKDKIQNLAKNPKTYKCAICCKPENRKLYNCSQKGCSSKGLFHAICALREKFFGGVEMLPNGTKKAFLYCKTHSPLYSEPSKMFDFGNLEETAKCAESFSPLKKFFGRGEIENSLKKRLSFGNSHQFADKNVKDDLRNTTNQIQSEQFSDRQKIELIKLLEQLSFADKEIAQLFKKNIQLIALKKYRQFLSLFDRNVVRKAACLINEQIASAFEEFGDFRCLKTNCLAASKFTSFCHKCHGPTHSPKQSELPANAAFLTELLVEKSLDLILRYASKAATAGRKTLRENGGDIVFLLRNIALKTNGKLQKKSFLVINEVIQLVKNVTMIHDNSSPSELLVYLELIHALSSLSDADFEAEKAQITKTLTKTDGSVILLFDPHSEKPPFINTKLPCAKCGKTSQRKNCPQCLVPYPRGQTVDIDSLCSGVIWLSVFEDVGVPFKTKTLSASLKDALKFLRWLRPYRSLQTLGKTLFVKQCYFVTHLVFITSNARPKSCWAFHRLDPKTLLEEFFFLAANLSTAIRLKDPELVGEFLQCLRVFGLPESHFLLKAGVAFLLRRVTAKGKVRFRKGGWVDCRHFYTKYHAAYCAAVGLAGEPLFSYRHELPTD